MPQDLVTQALEKHDLQGRAYGIVNGHTVKTHRIGQYHHEHRLFVFTPPGEDVVYLAEPDELKKSNNGVTYVDFRGLRKFTPKQKARRRVRITWPQDQIDRDMNNAALFLAGKSLQTAAKIKQRIGSAIPVWKLIRLFNADGRFMPSQGHGFQLKPK